MELELVDAPVFRYDAKEVYLTLLQTNIERIQFFEAVDSDTYMVMSDGSRTIVNAPLYEIEELLPSDSFFRCGWSHIVNTSRINRCYMFNDTTIIMDCGEEILVPRFQRSAVRDIMEKLYFNQDRRIG